MIDIEARPVRRFPALTLATPRLHVRPLEVADAPDLDVILADRLTQRWLAKDLGEPLRRAGMALFAVGVGVVVTALMPNVVLAVIASTITYFIGGLFYPPFLTTQALVSPARVRTLSFGFGSLFLVGGVWALWLIPGVATVSDNHGIRWGLGVLAPYWLVGGLVLASAGR